MNKSMWKNLREQYTDYTQADVARMTKKTRQAIYIFESGRRPMPKELQIIYLGFRNNDYDKANIQFLKGLIQDELQRTEN